MAQTKKGMRIQVIPLQRRLMMVVRKLTAPRSEEVIRKTIPNSQKRLTGHPGTFGSSIWLSA